MRCLQKKRKLFKKKNIIDIKKKNKKVKFKLSVVYGNRF